MLAGLEKPTKGNIIIKKKHIEKLTEEQLAIFRQKYIGCVFQSYNLLLALTVLKNVALPLVFQGVPKAERDKRAKTIPSADPKTYEISMVMEYEDADGNEITATEYLGIPVEQTTKLEVADACSWTCSQKKTQSKNRNGL